MVEFILYVADQELSRNFYKSVLGKDPVLDVPGMTEFLLSENCKLGLMSNKGIAKILGNKTPHPETGNGIPRNELYLYAEDVNKMYSNAIIAGAKEISPVSDRDWGDSVGYLADPDGHIIAFAKKI